jgi:hypothetical protein
MLLKQIFGRTDGRTSNIPLAKQERSHPKPMVLEGAEEPSMLKTVNIKRMR